MICIVWQPVQAEERGPRGIVRVGIFPFEPFNFIDEKDVAQGLNPDLLREIVRDEDWKIEFVPGSWAENLDRLQKQEIDLMMSVAYSPERAESMDYTYESVVELWGQVFVRPEGKSYNINNLSGLRVAVMRKDISGINFIKTAESLGVFCEIREFNTHAEVFAAVKNNKADAGVAPQHFGLRHAGEYNLVGSTILFSPFSIYFASRKGTQHELLSHIDAHLSKWKIDKESFYYQNINRWMGNLQKRQIPLWFTYSFIAAIFSALIFSGFTLLLKRTVRRKTEELRESEEKFRSLAESSRDCITRFDRQGRFTYINPAGLAILGLSEGEIIGRSHKEAGFSEEQNTILGNKIRQVFETGKPYQMEFFRHSFSGPVYLDLQLSPEHDGKARISSVLGVSRDITERKQLAKIQAFLADTSTGTNDEAFFYMLARFLAENLDMDFVCIDRLEGDGLTARTVAVWCDGQFEDNVSYALKDTPCGEVVGQSVCCYPASVIQFFPNDLVLKDLRAESYVGVTLLSHTGSAIGLIAVIGRQPLKSRHLAEATLKMVAVRAAGEMERLDAEIALRQSEEQYRLIFNTAQEGIWGVDAMMRTTFVNPRMAAMLGYEPEEMMGRVLEDFFFQDEDLADHCRRMQERQQGKDDQYQRRFRHKEGHSIWTSVSATALINNEGDFIGSFGMFTDISENKLAEKLLIENNELLNNLAHQVPGVIYQYRLYPDGRSAFPYASQGMNSIYEVSPEAVKEDATPVFGRLHPDDHDRVAETIFESARTLETFYCEFRVILPLQGLCWRWSQAQPQRMEDGSTLWHGIISDITERKKSEETLRASEEDLKESQRIAHVGSWRLDVKSNQVVWSDELYKMYGLDPKYPPPPYTEHYKLFTSESWNRLSAALQKTRDTGIPYDLELETHRIDGSRGWMWVRGMEILDEKGVTVGLRGMAQDLTERKRTEEEKKNLIVRLQQAQKMQAIGTLAGGIAHDFNNILGAILGYSEMIQEDCPIGSQMRSDIDSVVEASHRAKELVKQILAFSRQSESEERVLQPALVLKEAMKMLRASLPKTIDIRQRIDPEAGLILADPTQIHQVITNLCTNAFHAMEETCGILNVSLKNKEFFLADLVSEPHVRPGHFIEISVGDTGPGIAPEIMDKIFDPFFTTKEVGKGTGMGLAIIHGIAKQSGGFVSCTSSPGQGTVFFVYLPIHADTVSPDDEIAPMELIQTGIERILFVDDEEMLAKMGEAILTRLGYRVTVETNSIEALKVIQSQPDRFDLVITDQTMPGMTGSDLARRILQIRPEMPIILCTGFSNQISEEKARIYGIKGFAMKPLAKKDLAALIRKVLDDQ